jgi:hypothetical protein
MMRIVEILLPKGTSDRSLSPQTIRKIDTLQKRMDSYIDRIMDPKTSKAGKEFLKSKLRDDFDDLRETLPQIEESIQLNELFDAPVEWNWNETAGERATAYFTVEGKPYTFTAILQDEDTGTWGIVFQQKEKATPAQAKAAKDRDKRKGTRGFIAPPTETGVLGTGNSATVFSTVVDILKSFAENYAPSRLVFSAEPESRARLYTHIVKRLAPQSKIMRVGSMFMVTLPDAVENNLTEWKKSTTYDKAAKGVSPNPKSGNLTCDKCGKKFSKLGIGKHRCIPKSTVNEAVTRIPITNDDFKLVMKVMERPIPAAIAPIYISQIIEDDELNDQLFSLEDSQPGLDVRPIIAEWFNRIMPDQMYRFTGDEQTSAQKNGVLSLIHGYDSHNYKGTNDPITGDAFGFR